MLLFTLHSHSQICLSFSQTLSLCYVFLAPGNQVYLLSGHPSTITIPQPQRPQHNQWEPGQTQTQKKEPGSGLFRSRVQNLLLKVQTGLPRCQQNIKSCPISSTCRLGAVVAIREVGAPVPVHRDSPLLSILPLEIWSILSKTSATDSQASSTQQQDIYTAMDYSIHTRQYLDKEKKYMDLQLASQSARIL